MRLEAQVLEQFLPYYSFHCLATSSLAFAAIVNIHPLQESCWKCLYFCISTFTYSTIVPPVTFFRLAEILRAESVALVAEVQKELCGLGTRRLIRYGYPLRRVPLGGRMFRRRPLGFRLGGFMLIQQGFCVAFMRQIFDNTINFIFMVKATESNILPASS